MFLFPDSARCPDAPQVILDPSCQRTHNEICSYTCGRGYTPTNTSEPNNNVTCTTSSAWDKPISSLCEKIKCPATIPNGNISAGCSRDFDDLCYYDCDIGFRPPTYLAALTCNALGQWKWYNYRYSALEFCISEKDFCPSDIKNGSLSYSCDRYNGDTCSFSCATGCRMTPDTYRLTCHNSTWDFDTDLLCTDCVQCKSSIPLGYVDMTNCYAGANCSYSCYNQVAYAKHENVSTVTCSNATTGWIPSIQSSNFTTESDLCVAMRCVTDIPNGHLLNSCAAEVGSVCRYKCDVGYHGNVSEINCRSGERWDNRYSGSTEVVTFWSVDQHQLCTNSKQCPFDEIPHGKLDSTCRRNPGDICPYTCDYGYRSTYRPSNQTKITCTSSSTWDTSLSFLCERIRCPSTIPNGYTSCYNKNFNDHCYTYYCNYGYQPSQDYPSLKCNASSQWEWTTPSTLEFCIGEEELCPSNIRGGWLSYDCHRTEGSMCTYHCSSGCRNETSPYFLTCRNKTWDTDTDHLCTQCTTTTTSAPVRCPSRLPGGYVYSSCERTSLSSCDYYCDSGCSKQLTSLQCNSYGEWISADLACSCKDCPYSIPNGYISGSFYGGHCDFKPGSTCKVKCNEGCTEVFSTAHCGSNGRWEFANLNCDCTESTTHKSDSGSPSTVAIIMSVLGAMAFLVIVTVVITVYHKRLPKPPAQNNFASQSYPYQITTTTNNDRNSDMQVSSTHGTVENIPTHWQQSNITNANYIQGPPLYSELSFVKLEQTTPPPSYEDVTPHPLEVTSQPLSSTTDNATTRF